MELFRQYYWSRLPFPSPGDLLKPGIEPTSLVSSPALAGGFFTSRATEEALCILRFSNSNLGRASKGKYPASEDCQLRMGKTEVLVSKTLLLS